MVHADQKVWMPLTAYKILKALTFESQKGFDHAIEVIWDNDELFGMPRAHAGSRVIIVPAEAVELLASHGLQFITCDVR